MKNSAETSTEYYTPKLEDLYVGYELQLFAPEVGHWGWYILKETDSPSDFIEAMEIDNVRTPFLTKEQIIEQGWEYGQGNVYSKGEHVLIVYDNKKIEIRYLGSPSYQKSTFYLGVCPSINEFKKIMEWLEINL